jgi:phosphoglycerate dehydrogenase-like enzyme
VHVPCDELIDEAALVDALARGRIRGAGLDVYAHERLPPDHPLLEVDNVLLTPHVPGATTATSRARGAIVADDVKRVALGLAPLHEVGGAGSPAAVPA